jgi:hypothetical protein
MLSRVRVAALGQVGAMLVVLALTGAPRVAALLAPPERHACRCSEHLPGEACTCPICRTAALEATADDASLPPCHRAAARKALASEPRPAPAGAPCATGSCGALDPRPVAASGVEPFVLPAPPAALRAPLVARLVERTARPSQVARAPETPPPRRLPRPG